MNRAWLFIILSAVLLYSIEGCSNIGNLSYEINTAEETFQIFQSDIVETAARGEDSMPESDFCVIGEVNIKNMEVIKEEIKWKVEGEFIVRRIVYGNPDTTRILFSTIYHEIERGNPFGPQRGYSLEELQVIAYHQWDKLNQGDFVIVLGKGSGENALVIKAIRPFNPERAEKMAECIRIVKHLQMLKDADRQKQEEKILAESDDIELLFYLIREGYKNGGLERQISMIERLFTLNKGILKRKYIAYLFAVHIVVPPAIVLLDTPPQYIPSPFYKYYENITSQQSQRLKDIITESLSGVTTIPEGILYLKRIIRIPIINKDVDFKNKLKNIIMNLSQRFAADKGYPEWEKWVKKIFPDEEGKPDEPKPEK